MKTLKDRTEEAIAAGYSVGALAKAAGISSSAVSQWRSGNTTALKAETAAKLEELTGWAAAWWATGKGAKMTPKLVVDHSLSHPDPTLPSLIQWEVLVNKENMPAVPDDFVVEMPDGSLEPRLMKGEKLWFKKADKASPKNVVLIEAAGRRWIRRYAEDVSGPKAQALDDAFPSFTEFSVLAVMYMRPQDSI